ncbi:TAXI family TRAP transporter solute-binding subunit [Sphingomonas sp. AOB5]|uniref:TAXI family TRAP transporter solute-binding subunit n=1 Tax=Sphingomonas sp. AOB5 TaxID=3034017 RepID=UPI0023F6E8B4|nr:TAXI family TRAP transporter solute-binding subunit [Sphingomonas sp. AOB5]MDF7775617.1 TAXI family TRAP transporter solute-binding subunit [Sphingomonas sp. AOB5]
MQGPDGPRIDRSVTLHMQGDWGLANFHRILGWLTSGFCERAGPHSRTAIWTGAGGRGNVRAVSNGLVDLAIMTPASLLTGALTGEGAFAGESHPGLRALAVLPQRDVMAFALRGEHGFASFAEIIDARPPLRIAVAPDDGDNLLGWAGQHLLEAVGLARDTLESWGGRYVEYLHPSACLDAVRRGEADAVVQEAIMGPWWRSGVKDLDLRFLDVPADALAALARDHRWPSAVLPADYIEGQPQPVTTLDFADFVAVVRDDMAEDVAHLLTWCLTETRHLIEAQYRHIPPERSPLTWPLDPAAMARSPIPLHPGAARHYAELSVLAADAMPV